MIRTCAILLAAGRSRRMGGQKLLLPFAGKTVIAHIADQILASPVRELVVVTHRSSDRDPSPSAIAPALAGRPLTLVTNPNPDGDMLSSVRCGLRVLPAGCQAVLVVLGDQPSICPELIEKMAGTFRDPGRAIVVPVHAGQRGHPLLFSVRYRDELLTRYDGLGLRALLQSHPNDVHELEAPDSVLSDMDTPDDYRRELEKLDGRESTPDASNAD